MHPQIGLCGHDCDRAAEQDCCKFQDHNQGSFWLIVHQSVPLGERVRYHSVMMNRREFVRSAALFGTSFGASFGTSALSAAPTKYDLIIKGGRVVDPSRKLNSMLDVAIAQGKIAAVRANL